MADKNQFLVTFEGVSASVGGVDISAIIELQLTAVANDIPQITLLVDGMNSGSSGTAVSAAASLDNASQIVNRFRSMIKKDGSTLSLSVTCRAAGPGGGDTQSLTLSGWILTDVSLSPVQRSGVCAAALTFMHPICKAHFGGAVPGLLSAPPDFSSLSGSNPMEVFLSALEIYGEAAQSAEARSADVDGAPDTDTARGVLLQHMTKAASDLESSLTWKGGGLPAESYLGEYDDTLREGIASYAMPGSGTSVFQRFSRMLVPECSLAIGGDYTQSALEVGPNEPWAETSLTIDDSDIVSLQFPASDPSPLSGIRIVANNTADALPPGYHVVSCQTGDAPAEIFYIPQSELSAEYLYGPIQQFQEPSWLGHMANGEQNRDDYRLEDTVLDQDGNLSTAVTVGRGGSAGFSGGGGEQSGTAAISYSEAMLACAKAYYETSLMKDWSFTANLRLRFSAGGCICPGRVLGVQAGSGEILSGYVVAVTHTISVPNRAASTSVVCTHPRFGGRPDAITSGKNALYS